MTGSLASMWSDACLASKLRPLNEKLAVVNGSGGVAVRVCEDALHHVMSLWHRAHVHLLRVCTYALVTALFDSLTAHISGSRVSPVLPCQPGHACSLAQNPRRPPRELVAAIWHVHWVVMCRQLRGRRIRREQHGVPLKFVYR